MLPKCNQCDSATINGLYCHEKGCPNIDKVWDYVEKEWEFSPDEINEEFWDENDVVDEGLPFWNEWIKEDE